MSDNWTQVHMERAIEWHRLFDEEKDAEADVIWNQLTEDLGPEERSALLDFIEEKLEEKNGVSKPKAKSKGVLQPARRMSKTSEHWRCLSNYPLYEISSYGRVRALDRAKPGDCLKPRYKWILGKAVPFVVIKDRDGRRCERMIGKLLIAAGFMAKPAWMEKRNKDEASTN